MILVHGRGATAESILGLANELAQPDFAYLAPQAAGHTWYPLSFLAPLEQNEPGLGSGLALLQDLIVRLEGAGIPAERTMLLGFSQGACLTAEYVARRPRRYGGMAALTGGLIGPPGTPRQYAGDLEDTPVYLGAGDPDPHVPWERVEETARVYGDLGAQVTLRRFPGMGHTVNHEELAAVRGMMSQLIGS